MATKNIKGNHTAKVDVTTSADTWNLLKNATIVSPDYGFYGEVGATNNMFNIAGYLQSGLTGIVGQGNRMTVDVAGTGKIVSPIGIYMAGTGRLIVDIDGELVTGHYGIQSFADVTEVHLGKAGSITGTYAIYVPAVAGATSLVARIAGDIEVNAGGITGIVDRMRVDVAKTGSIVAENGIAMGGSLRLVVNMDGQLNADQYGISSAAADTEVNLGRKGSITGGYGIYVTGATLVAEIDGDINAIQYGIRSDAPDTKIHIGHGGTVASTQVGIYSAMAGAEVRNEGEVSGFYGIQAVGDGGLIVNGRDGFISGMLFGLAASTSTGDAFRIINHGTVVGAFGGFSIVCGDGNERITNDGRLVGAVVLEDGDDLFDTRGGSVKGQIDGSAGDDTLITDKASHKLTELAGQGTDTVKSTVSYTLSAEVEKLFLLGTRNTTAGGNDSDNLLHGNTGNNKLSGQAGLDNLFGHKGNDKLTGGADADIFHFSTGDGHDTIIDFAAGVDDVDISRWNAISDFSQLLNDAENDGHGNVIIKAGGNSLMIKGMLESNLDPGDFIF